eukprot:scaffold14.g1183.t1
MHLEVGCLALYLGAIAFWLYSEYLTERRRRSTHGHGTHAESAPLLVVVQEGGGGGGAAANGAPAGGPDPPSSPGLKKEPMSPVAKNGGPTMSSSAFYRCLQLEEEALVGSRDVLRAAVEFGTIILWFYVADRTDLIAPGQKTYTRDLFVFLFVVLTAAAVGYSLKPARAPVLLHRTQTEEWKGWMQARAGGGGTGRRTCVRVCVYVMGWGRTCVRVCVSWGGVLFLLYHYYNAKEIYNAIRVFIAAYVWMTGFGNFAYYHKTSDFSLGRFCQMMWRLNFLVLFCCLALNNSYMLYYICPMHTLFTIMVYAGAFRGVCLLLGGVRCG